MRPSRVVLVAGTGTEVGKTWVTVELARRLRARGHEVRARKLAQSYDPGDPPAGRDAALLARASGEDPDVVCPPHRSYPRAMAPPMAAAALGRPPILLADLLAELGWDRGDDPRAPERPVVGLLETAGGVRAPQADDGDVVDLVVALRPDRVVLVADAGLGTLNLVRLSVDALVGAGVDPLVVLNRFEEDDELHRRNREWLTVRWGMAVLVAPRDLATVADRIAGPGALPGTRDG